MNILISAIAGLIIGCVIADLGGTLVHTVIACGVAGLAIGFAGIGK